MDFFQATRRIFPFILSFSLVACGGSGFSNEGSTDDSNTSSNPDTTDPGTLPETPTLRLGNKDSSSFSEGDLFVSASSLPAGGSTSIKAWMVDPTGLPYPGVMTVSILSDCIADGLATVDNPTEFTTGVITANYVAKGCRDTDSLTMRVNYENKVYTATTNITIDPPVIGSVRYDSSSRDHIGIKGVGLDEVSTLKFQVLDDNGNPVSQEDVRFKLNTTIGGITVLPEIGKTDDNGYVTVDVHSGSVSTSVKVTAEVISKPNIFTQSRRLVISTGIADQNSISISAESLNPEAFDYNNVETQISILAADHFNNPVPDGTAIFFTAEGGIIGSQCLTENGGCFVKWRSSDPRPADGRVTILASLLGEESFSDKNGNGILDDGENFDDLGVVFRDDNEDGVLNGDEEPRDSGANGVQVANDGEYNGILCNPLNTVNICSENKNIFVNKSIVLVMSTSEAKVEVADTIQVSGGGNVTFPVLVSDRHEQPLPVGTTVNFSIDGEVVRLDGVGGLYPHKLISASNRTISNTNINGFTTFDVTVSDNFAGKVDSFLKIKVTTPNGTLTEKVVNLQDSSQQVVVVDGEAEDPATILFEGAEPSQVGIRGFGLNEISQVRFRVVDESGRSIADQPVNFSFASNLGGASIQPTRALTNDQGYVIATVRAGTLATTVKVLAEVEGFTNISTQSRGLVISTGVADQDSVSLSAKVLNLEAWNRDGVSVDLTMFASDHFNNPVPDDTAVNFTAEGGQIDSFCLIKNGKCQVKWTSSNPYPADHRVTILATILGEESFADTNGNGVFDDGEKFFDTAEVFRDDNENDVFDAFDSVNNIYEESRDYNNNGQYDGKNGLYDGVLCSINATLCSNEPNIYASDSVVLVLSDTTEQSDGSSPIRIVPSIDKIIFDKNASSQVVSVTVSDVHGQPLPANSAVTIAITDLSSFRVNGGNSTQYFVPSTNNTSGTKFNFTISDALFGGTSFGNGLLTIGVTTPGTIHNEINVPIQGYRRPSAISDFATTSKDTPVEINILNNDQFNGTYADGNITITTSGVNTGAEAVINAVGNIEYTPALDFVGTEIFNYTITDSLGSSDSSSVTISIVE